MERIFIEKVNIDSVDRTAILEKYFKNPSKYQLFVDRANSPKYLYWDKMRYLPTPDDMSKVELWFLIKQIRFFSSLQILIKSETGEYFRWFRLKETDEYLHKIDFYSGGHIFEPFRVLDDIKRQKFLGRGIIEEAIASSQIEGANTTRPVAKKMILENRKPRNRSELMIINNYKVMKNIEERYKDSELTKELLFMIHSELLEGEKEVPDDEKKRYRTDKDEIVVRDVLKIAHVPPKNEFLLKEMDRVIDYANDKGDENFVHPIIKAIFLHFWLGYLHPFTDGNGRLARAIFYWYLLRKGYWTMLFLPISTIIKKSRISYDQAYLYSEQDGLDITYFFDYHIKKIIQAIEEFMGYLNKITDENRIVDDLLSTKYELSLRQKQLIYYLIEEGGNAYSTATSHSIINNISRQTAAQDLKELENAGILESKKVGKFVRYNITDHLKGSLHYEVPKNS